MKKLSFVLAIAILFTAIFSTNVVALNIGDKLGDVLNTDVKTYINGERIPCFNINNKSVIIAEDLKNYGFDVVWNATERTISVTRNYDKQFTPIKDIANNTEKAGTIAFSYLYTDIIATVDGKRVDGFNIKGNVAIYFADLGDYGTFSWNGSSKSSSLTLYKNPASQYVFSLTDDEIKTAIEEGKKGVTHVSNNIDSKYIVKPTIASAVLSKYNEVRVFTPYLYISRTSAIETTSYKTYSFDSAKSYYNNAEKATLISFEFRLCELQFENKSSINIGVFQNGKQVETVVISGLTGFPQRSKNYPNQPAYQRIATASISSQLGVDIDMPLTIKINYAGLEESVYEVNLKNYK